MTYMCECLLLIITLDVCIYDYMYYYSSFIVILFIRASSLCETHQMYSFVGYV